MVVQPGILLHMLNKIIMRQLILNSYMNIIHFQYLIKYVLKKLLHCCRQILYHFCTRLGIAFSHEKRENGKFVDEKFPTGKSDKKNGKLSSLKLGIFG